MGRRKASVAQSRDSDVEARIAAAEAGDVEAQRWLTIAMWRRLEAEGDPLAMHFAKWLKSIVPGVSGGSFNTAAEYKAQLQKERGRMAEAAAAPYTLASGAGTPDLEKLRVAAVLAGAFAELRRRYKRPSDEDLFARVGTRYGVSARTVRRAWKLLAASFDKPDP